MVCHHWAILLLLPSSCAWGCSRRDAAGRIINCIGIGRILCPLRPVFRRCCIVHVTISAHCQLCAYALLAAKAPPTNDGVHIMSFCAGKDATQDFEEIGHSKSARDMLDKYLIGAFAVSS